VTQLWSTADKQRPAHADPHDEYFDVTQLDSLSCSLHKCLLTLPIGPDEDSYQPLRRTGRQLLGN
jgi:hypothetical protein